MKTSILFVTGALALGGCASSKAREPATTPQTEARQAATAQQESTRGGMMGNGEMAGMCPMRVDGTTVRAEEVEGGAAMVFTTTGDVAELRQRVAAMAEMHDRRHADGNGHGMGMHSNGGGMQGAKDSGMQCCGGKGMKGQGMMMIPPATVRTEEVDGGARLVFTPQDPADLSALREHFAQHAKMMASGRCPMMLAPPPKATEGAPASEASQHESHHPEGGH